MVFLLLKTEDERDYPAMWSQKFKECIKCGTRERKHLGRGLCVNCYQIDIENRHKQNRKPEMLRGPEEIPHRVLTKEYLIREYCENSKSLGDIGKACNCSRQYIYKKIKSYGLTTRDKTSARTLALEGGKIIVMRPDDTGNATAITFQKTKHKEDFFSSWSPEMAYVLGVIYTDGNLTPGSLRDPSSKTTLLVPRVTVYQKEPELLKKILSLQESNSKLLFRKKRVIKSKKGDKKDIVAGEIYYFHIHGDKIYDDLVALGLFPNKSLKLQFPQVPSNCIRHFIRGCWDGDGSIYVENSTNKKAASFVSGSKKFIAGLLAELEKLGMPKRTIHENKGKNISYYFRFTGDQCDKLFHILYDDVPSTQYLERKHNIFKPNELDEGLEDTTQDTLLFLS
jgi:hypothetical protein